MKAIIPTGGRGTRMQPLTFSLNKHFIPIANKPLIYYPIETIAKSGVKEIAITYNPGWLDTVKQFLGDGSKWGLKFSFILQERPLGLANIFQVCEEYLNGSPFFLHLGDNIFTEGIKKHVDYFEKNKPDGLVAMVHHKENTRLGVPYFDKKGRLVKYVEKPKNPPHDFAIPGVYFFNNNVFKCFKGKDAIKPSERGEYEISFPYQWLIDHGYRVDVLEYDGKWLDPGKFDDWIEANQYLLDRDTDGKVLTKIDSSVHLKNRVSVGKGCKIKDSEIRGPVSISDNVEIRNSYIGPYTSIAQGCVIDKSKVENSVLMAKVKIFGVKKTIDESLIGSEAEIIHEEKPGDTLNFFVGEKCKIKV